MIRTQIHNSRDSLFAILVSLLVFSACFGSATSTDDAQTGPEIAGGEMLDPGGGEREVQELGVFWDILARGEIPASGTLSVRDFLGRHTLTLPVENHCVQEICLTARTTSLSRSVDGRMRVGALIDIDAPPTLGTAPLATHFVLALDTGASMEGPKLDQLRQSLLRWFDTLKPDDRITIVSFQREAQIRILDAPAQDPRLHAQVGALVASGESNIYDGLRRSYETIDALPKLHRESRVILISDGNSDRNLVDFERIAVLSARYARHGTSTSVLALGSSIDADLVRTIADNGHGPYYFLEAGQALDAVLVQEQSERIELLATDAILTLQWPESAQMQPIWPLESAKWDRQQISIDLSPITRVQGTTPIGSQRGGFRGQSTTLAMEWTLPSTFVSFSATAHLQYRQNDTFANKTVSTEIRLSDPRETTTPASQALRRAKALFDIFTTYLVVCDLIERGDLPDADRRLADQINATMNVLPHIEALDLYQEYDAMLRFRENIRSHYPGLTAFDP